MTVLMRRSMSCWAVASSRLLRLAAHPVGDIQADRRREAERAPIRATRRPIPAPSAPPRPRPACRRSTRRSGPTLHGRPIGKLLLIVHVLYALSSRLCRSAAARFGPRKKLAFYRANVKSAGPCVRDKRRPNRGRARGSHDSGILVNDFAPAGPARGSAPSRLACCRNATARCRQAAKRHRGGRNARALAGGSRRENEGCRGAKMAHHLPRMRRCGTIATSPSDSVLLGDSIIFAANPRQGSNRPKKETDVWEKATIARRTTRRTRSPRKTPRSRKANPQARANRPEQQGRSSIPARTPFHAAVRARRHSRRSCNSNDHITSVAWAMRQHRFRATA